MSPLRQRFRDAVRATPDDLATPCLIIAAQAEHRDNDIEAILADGAHALAALAHQVSAQGPPDDRLRSALGTFGGDAAAYGQLESSLLPHVLSSHRGLPILVSVVWLETARRVGIGACGLALPGRFVVAVGTEHEQPQTADLVAGTCVVVDPFTGGRPLTLDDVRSIAREHGGPESADDLETLLAPAAPVDVLHRILGNIMRWADRPERTSTALWACEFALALPRRPATMLRQHAELLGRSGRFIEAADTYNLFADEVELVDAQAAERARILARLNRSRLN